MKDKFVYHDFSGTLRRFLAESLEELTNHIADAWNNIIRPLLPSWSKATCIKDLEIQEIAKVFTGNIEVTGTPLDMLFSKHKTSRETRHYFTRLKAIRNRYAHGTYIPIEEQMSDVIICRHLVEEVGKLRAKQGPEMGLLLKQISDAIRQCVIHYAEAAEITLPGSEAQDTSGGRGADEVLVELRNVTDSIEHLGRDISTLIGSIAAGSFHPDENATLDSSLKILQENVRIQGKGLSSLGERFTNTELLIAEVLGKLLDLDEKLEAGTSSGEHSGETGVSDDSQVENPADHDEFYDGSDEDDENGETDTDATLPPVEKPEYSPLQIRDQLIALRSIIWKTCGTGPSTNGLLRRRMIRLFVDNRITNQAGFEQAIPNAIRRDLDQRESPYLPEVFRIVAAMKQ